MKILYLTIDRTKMIVSHFENWHKDLSSIADVDFVIRNIGKHKTGRWANLSMARKIDTPSLLHDVDVSKYDWIITDSNFGFVTENWNDIKIPKAMIIEDCHSPGNIDNQMELATRQKIDIIFYRYKEAFLTYQKKHLNKFDCRWLPFSVNLEMFKDYGLDKNYDVTMTGWHFPSHYPYRHRAFKLLKDKEYFTEIKRPSENITIKNFPFDSDYAQILNQSKISITGGSIYKQSMMKYFEYPACRCLLVSNWFRDLEELGFRDGVNMVVTDYDRLDEQIKILLADDDRRKELTDNGYKFIRSYHSGQVRAKQLLLQLGGK